MHIVKCTDSEAVCYVILFYSCPKLSWSRKDKNKPRIYFSGQTSLCIFSPHTYPERKSQMFYPVLVQWPDKIKFTYMTCRCLIKWINYCVQTVHYLWQNGAQFSKPNEIRNNVCRLKLHRLNLRDHTKNTNVMHLILFIRQIFSSTCFEYQVLIFRRI